jgi:hypothetical protein
MNKNSRALAKDSRRNDLHKAILRVQNRKMALSITAVAEEAGVTPALLHNTYPDVAEYIRSLIGKNSRARNDEFRAENVRLRETNRQLRLEKEAAQADARRLASLLERLRFELAVLEAQKVGNVTPIGRRLPRS